MYIHVYTCVYAYICCTIDKCRILLAAMPLRLFTIIIAYKQKVKNVLTLLVWNVVYMRECRFPNRLSLSLHVVVYIVHFKMYTS